MRAVVPPVLGLRPRPPAVVDPALGQQTLAVPDAVPEVEVAETGEVGGGGVHERGGHPGAGRVESGLRGTHPDRLEEPLCQEAAIVLRGAECAGDGGGHEVAGAAGVRVALTGLRGEPALRRVCGHVLRTRAEEHVDDVGVAVVLGVRLVEVEPVAHLKHLLQCDGAARVRVRLAPPGQRGRGVRAQTALADEDAHHRVQHRLGHRPGQQTRIGADRLGRPVEEHELPGVPLVDEAAAMDDHHRLGLADRLLRIEGLGQQGLEALVGGQRPARPLLGRPGQAVRLRGQRDRRLGGSLLHGTAAFLVLVTSGS